MLCTVCACLIHSKNILQAAKYGSLSCEYCRKFISKISKKSLAIKNYPAMKLQQQLLCKSEGMFFVRAFNYVMSV